MKLNESDFKLFSYLYHHNRESITKIAKATKLSREQVDYKIKKYISEGLIKKFITVFDWSKFGYTCFTSLLIKFEKPCSKNTFIKKLTKNKNCISWGSIFGEYDLYVNYIFKNEKQLSDYLSNLISSPNPISDYKIIKPYFAELYPLKFFHHKERENFLIIGEESKKIKLNEKDKEILKILAENGRTKLIDIAIKLNISSELALYKLKKLQKEKVILGSRIQFDLEKLGHYFSQILLSIRNFSEENKNKLKQFARQSKYINSLIFSLMKPNCNIQLFYKEEFELRKTINELREIFKNEQIEISVLAVNEDEGKINTLPFL